MQYLSCGNINIPLCFVQSISWTRTAKTVERNGGYITSRGYEAAEVSVRVSVSPSVCTAFGLSLQQWFGELDALTADRLAPSTVLRVAGYTAYPELEFALTNINKTTLADECGETGIIEADMIFSGVAATKEVSRERALQMDATVSIPLVSLSVGGKSLSIQDGFQITEFTTSADSIHLSIECGTDMDLVHREGFLTDILDGGTVEVELPTGATRFYVISAFLVDNELVVEGGVYPVQSQQTLTKTYMDCDISIIITDLAKHAGIECECKVSGHVDYYKAFGTPVECLRALQDSAGFIMSYRQGRLTVADVPKELVAAYTLEYLSMDDDSDSEPITGCYWFDGVNKDIAGTVDTGSIRIQSAFRSTEGYAARCLSYARYMKNSITVSCDINVKLDSHSVVSVQSNDANIPVMVESFENDWINNLQTLELHAV